MVVCQRRIELRARDNVTPVAEVQVTTAYKRNQGCTIEDQRIVGQSDRRPLVL